ncbi:hypothetical protein [Kluyvera genomosp. 3]|uniref:Uncharacterized protein n=1 Tax=Kluyvera genomosp. 3 TaxID=2774055 RepID=A0A6G9RIA7_9ENTR|nr:hypothetical protein [Kluyvera genomosp. 3]QIR26696.1 hypothetical protein GY169_07635 [Kluyvera genomosp. 3]
MFNNVKYECFSQYVILNNARVSALADRVEALEEIAAEYEAERYEETHEAMTVAEAKAGKEKHYVNGEGLTPAQVATLNEYAKAQPAPASITGNRDQFDANDAAYSAGFADGEAKEKQRFDDFITKTSNEIKNILKIKNLTSLEGEIA